jgi:hypothetical protein
MACSNWHEKQKDAVPFDPLIIRLERVDESCVVLLHDGRGVSDGLMLPVERQALRSLHEGFLEDGASVTAWLKASGMPESSFYKARTALVKRELVEQAGKGRGARYTLAPHGKALMSLHDSTVTP